MEPQRNEPTDAKDEVVETSDNTNTTQSAPTTTAPIPAAVPSSNPPVSDPAPNRSENLQLINMQSGPLPSSWAAGTPASTAATTSHDQSTNSSKKTSNARGSREPHFPAVPPTGLGQQDREDYADVYESKCRLDPKHYLILADLTFSSEREAVNNKVFKHPRSAQSQ